MRIPINIRGEVYKEFKLVEEGKTSYGIAAKRLGIHKPTFYRWHIEHLKEEVAQLHKLKGKVQANLKGLEKSYAGLEAKYQEKSAHLEGDHKKLSFTLEGEIEKLSQEKALIKNLLEAQGLDWNQGARIIKDVDDLLSYLSVLRSKLTGIKAELNEKEKNLERVNHTTKRQTSLRNTLKAEINELQKARAFYLDWKNYEAPKIWQYQDDLQERTQKLQKETMRLEAYRNQLQEKNKSVENKVNQLERREGELSTIINDLEMKKEDVETTNKEMIEDAEVKKKSIEKACQEGIENATMEAKNIIRGAEEKREMMLAGVKEANEKLKAENAFLEAAGEPILKQLREERMRLEEAVVSAKKENRLPFPNKLCLPKIKSLNS